MEEIELYHAEGMDDFITLGTQSIIFLTWFLSFIIDLPLESSELTKIFDKYQDTSKLKIPGKLHP